MIKIEKKYKKDNKMIQIKIEVFDEELTLELRKTQYAYNGLMAIEAYNAETGEDFATLSVNLPRSQKLLEENEFFFDDNNDYFGIKKKMLEENVISETGKSGKSGFCSYSVCQLLVVLPNDI